MKIPPKTPPSDARLASDINLILAARQSSATETTRAVPPPDDQDPEAWLRAMFPGYVRDNYGIPHIPADWYLARGQDWVLPKPTPVQPFGSPGPAAAVR
jgi:hypothetical protein